MNTTVKIIYMSKKHFPTFLGILLHACCIHIFISGLYNSVTSEDPDTEHIERLLKGWCRTRLSVDGHEVIIKSAAHPSVVQLIEKYEKTNEFAIAMLARKLHLMNNGNDTLLRGGGVRGRVSYMEVVHMCRPV